MKKIFNNIEYETVSDSDQEFGCSKCVFRNQQHLCEKVTMTDENCDALKFYWVKVKEPEVKEPKIIKISTGTYRTIENTKTCDNCAFLYESCSEIRNIHHCVPNNCSFEKVEEPVQEEPKQIIVMVNGKDYTPISELNDCSGCIGCAFNNSSENGNANSSCDNANKLYDCVSHECIFVPLEEKTKIVNVDDIDYQAIPEEAEFECNGCAFNGYIDLCNEASEKHDCYENKVVFVKMDIPENNDGRKIIRISSGSYSTIPKGGCTNCAFEYTECSEINEIYHCGYNDCSFEKLPVPEGEVYKKDIDVKYWYDTSSYYQGIVVDIGKLFGIDAYTSDDGSIQDKVLAAKVYELVTGLVHENAKLKSQVAALSVKQ